MRSCVSSEIDVEVGKFVDVGNWVGLGKGAVDVGKRSGIDDGVVVACGCGSKRVANLEGIAVDFMDGVKTWQETRKSEIMNIIPGRVWRSINRRIKILLS